MTTRRSFRLLLLALAYLIQETASIKAANSQTTVGEPSFKPGISIPDYTFSEIQYFPKPSVSLRDFRGKWLILDFWSRNCAGCISAMPGLNKMQEELGEKLQIVLVGLNFSWAANREKKENPRLTGDDYTRSLYAKIRKRSKINLPVAWDTTLYYRLSGSGGVPYTVLIDPAGKVRACATGLTRTQVDSFMAGDNPLVAEYPLAGSDSASNGFNMWKPLLVNGRDANGGSDTGFIYRSLLMKSNYKIPPMSSFYFDRGTYQLLNAPLWWMYQIAFTGQGWDWTDSIRYGNVYYNPLLLTKDSNELRLGEKYCYSLTLNGIQNRQNEQTEKENESLLKRSLQHDLSIAFPYLATLEDRPQLYFRLVVTNATKARKIRSLGGEFQYFVHKDGLLAKNVSMKLFLGRLLVNSGLYARDYISNETGFSGQVDMKFEANMSDLSDVQKGLAQFGLKLQEGTKLMKTVVIKDSDEQ